MELRRKVNDIFSLCGCNALITGGTGYLGREMCYGLAEAGAHVVIQGRDEVKVQELVQEISCAGYSCEGAIFDLLDEDQTCSYFDKFALGKLNVLVNNAYSGASGTIECCSDNEYRDSYEVGLVVVQRLFKLCLSMLRQGQKLDGIASCINIASMYGVVSPDLDIYDSSHQSNPPFYGAVKAALIQWSRYAACEFGREGIRVNSISPGPFPNLLVQEHAPSFIDKLENKVPMKRIGQAKEIRGAVIFLASNAASYVNGNNLKVDGGWTCI